MIKLKRNDMLERGCIYCKYYEQWSCKLSDCYLDSKMMVGAAKEDNKHSRACDHCGYQKPGGCIGYCIQQVLAECKEIWSKNKSE